MKKLMKRSFDNDSGQLILITCVLIAIVLILISIYGYSTLMTGKGSIDRENIDSTYFYLGMRNRYINIYNNEYLDINKTTNITIFEKEMKQFSVLHGYSIDFIRDDFSATIIFVDKDMKIIEKINRY